MPFDVFALRDRVVGEYRDYVESFVHILDDRIEDFVRAKLAEGELWPDAVLQLNPAYEPGRTLKEIAAAGEIARETGKFFGEDLRLYRHQEEALAVARRDEPYIVSTGTGSGKSLTYLIPIVDHVLRDRPEDHSVRAIIVYPMNALINSQLDALEGFRDRNWPDAPLRFARYTGQEKSEKRNAILNDPPHILLTNYVMLEYMLIRPAERSLVHQATKALKFLAMDELHVYRGRQGADVAMLLRRVRQRAGRPNLLSIGTSATLVTAGDRASRRAEIAKVGTKLFGVEIPSENVIDESLQRVIKASVPVDAGELKSAVERTSPDAVMASVLDHPLAAWVEETFGLATENGRLVRRPPVAFEDGLQTLIEATGLPEDLCQVRLKAVLDAGNMTRLPSGEPLFAFRLHQFLASGGSVYATLEPPETRRFSTEGQYVAPGGAEGAGQKVQYPLAFCRECGQDYYLVSRINDDGEESLLPRSPRLNAPDDEVSGDPGFFSVEREGLWGEDEDLPDNWLEFRRHGARVKDRYASHVPQRIWVRPDGQISGIEVDDGLQGWWQPRPLMLCLRCRVAYDLRETSDFKKLVTLSQTGRSTATTVVSSGSIVALREQVDVESEARRLLSFTDNRQDASLQAGHTNDFAQVVLLRGSLVRALKTEGELTFDRIGGSIFAALDLDPQHFMKEPVDSGPGFETARRDMIDLLDYLALEDLARAWRVAQPNLEQCGLLKIDYAGLAELASDDGLWRHAPVIASVSPERRLETLRAVLDHVRSVLAIDAESLSDEATRTLVRRVNASLCDPWAFDELERLRLGGLATLPGVTPRESDRGVVLRLGSRSAIGRFLRSKHTWGTDENLSAQDCEDLTQTIIETLRGHILTIVERRGEPFGAQIMVRALRWELGDGKVLGPDPVRSKSLHLRRRELIPAEPNSYFSSLYEQRSRAMVGLLTAEHTGQISAEHRLTREAEFNRGRLSVLYCSPTMELGVDIKDLSVVHMRNIPPTPANYAQRSGRAGRGGKPALVFAFSIHGSAHDHYFFRAKEQMIAGSVAPPRLDIASRDLLEAHLHSVWLSIVQPQLAAAAGSIAGVLDLEDLAFPIASDLKAQLEMSEARFGETYDAFHAVAGTVGEELTKAPWYSERWLEDIARAAPEVFDRAFDRWRELYRAAIEQRDAARRKIDAPRADRREREAAKQQEREAQREIDLLLNRGPYEESDFYVYRYLGNEGFIPGYNFPRLPLRAFVTSGDGAHGIDRPRLLGLSEFGPGNVLYHEGRKHRVTSCIVPAGGIENRITRAKICLSCGYIHPREESRVDLCVHCGTRLDGQTSDFPQALFDQPAVRASRWVRISSEEEERAREGYVLSTHFRTAPGASSKEIGFVAADTREARLQATYLPQAELWRINHGWRRSAERNGFVLDGTTGVWRRRDDADDGRPAGADAGTVFSALKPYVTDIRNILFLRPFPDERADEVFLKSLAYAFRRAIQQLHQVEEQEVAVELIGREEGRRIMFWEAAEGGIGVWERLVEEPDMILEVSGKALEILHFDPGTGEERESWAERCPAACYDCLLSYSNQPDHRFLDRHLVRDYLIQLSKSSVAPVHAERSYEEQYRWLLDRVDPQSSLERTFLDHLYQNRLRLPDFAQYRPTPDVAVQPDFYYDRDRIPGVCLFVDGPHHDRPDQAEKDRKVRETLRGRGYRVVTIVYHHALSEQVAHNGDVFSKA